MNKVKKDSNIIGIEDKHKNIRNIKKFLKILKNVSNIGECKGNKENKKLSVQYVNQL